jgi:hypothetical protein
MTQYAYDAETGDEIDVEEYVREMLDECYDALTIGGIEFSPSRIVEELDPIMFRMIVLQEMDAQITDGMWTEENETVG